MTRKRPPVSTEALLEQQQNALAAGKASYILADQIGRKIARRIQGARRRTVSFIPGSSFKLINNTRLLREKGVLYGHGAVREWDIDKMTQAEQAQMAVKEA